MNHGKYTRRNPEEPGEESQVTVLDMDCFDDGDRVWVSSYFLHIGKKVKRKFLDIHKIVRFIRPPKRTFLSGRKKMKLKTSG